MPQPAKNQRNAEKPVRAPSTDALSVALEGHGLELVGSQNQLIRNSCK